MTQSSIERRLTEAFDAARSNTTENADLFSRVNRSVAEDRALRSWRRRSAAWATGYVLALGTIAGTFGNKNNGRFTMSWWLIEVLTNIVLISIAVLLGPFIKRFGRSYAADVFRANPRTGKSYLVLTDVAYYLIFTAFIFFTVSFDDHWLDGADQWKGEVARVGGILLIMGILHAANVVALPVIGQMLSSNGLDGPKTAGPTSANLDALAGAPPLGPGTWTVRIEPAMPAKPGPDQTDGTDPTTVE